MEMAQEELQRGFGLSTATYMVIASMIGTGILVSPGYMMAVFSETTPLCSGFGPSVDC